MYIIMDHRFHSNLSDNIILEPDRRVARAAAFEHSCVYSEKPLQPWELFAVKVAKVPDSVGKSLHYYITVFRFSEGPLEICAVVFISAPTLYRMY